MISEWSFRSCKTARELKTVLGERKQSLVSKQGLGKQIWAFQPPWRWKVESERRDCPWVPTLHKLLQKFQRCTKVVRKKVVDVVPSTVAAGGAAGHTPATEEYTEPDWSALERPHEAPWPFTILFVGVDNGDKL